MTDDIYDRDDWTEQGESDSGIMHEPVADPGIFQVYQAGRVTVVGFRGNDIPAGFWIGGYREALKSIVQEHDCEELSFDLTGVTSVPSGMLGLFVSLSELGVNLSVYNPSGEVREVLHTTNLNKLVEVRDIDIGTGQGD
jgi:anti-sigma B factor antagonist